MNDEEVEEAPEAIAVQVKDWEGPQERNCFEQDIINIVILEGARGNSGKRGGGLRVLINMTQWTFIYYG